MTLIVRGTSHVFFSGRNITAESSELKVDGKKIIIQSPGGGQTVCNISGSSYVCSGNLSVQATNDVVRINGPCKKIILNGQELSLLSTTDEDPPKVDYVIPDGHVIDTIQIEGAGRLSVGNDYTWLDTIIKINMSGNTTLSLGGNTFESMYCKIDGMSMLHGAISDDVVLDVCGMSRVDNVHANRSIWGTVSGKSKVQMTRAPSAKNGVQKSGTCKVSIAIIHGV